MARATWLAEALTRGGCQVEVVSGWQTRGSARFDPKGVVWHHTATSSKWSRSSVIRLIRDGRSDLPGPLSQLVLERDGTFLVVAAGRANHAGRGGWRGLKGNTSVIGIEACNDGRGELWTPPQVAAYREGTAAILARLGRDEQWMCGHKEWAPGRKVDPHGLDMDRERAAVRALLAGEDEDMSEVVKGMQRALGVPDDGIWGSITEGALKQAVARSALNVEMERFLAEMVTDLERRDARPTSVGWMLDWYRRYREGYPEPAKPGP